MRHDVATTKYKHKAAREGVLFCLTGLLFSGIMEVRFTKGKKERERFKKSLGFLFLPYVVPYTFIGILCIAGLTLCIIGLISC